MELEDVIKLLSRRGNSNGLREHRQIAEWLKELKAIKNIENGIIRNGKIYEVIKGNCSECAFDIEGESLCRDFCETFENVDNCICAFKEINKDEKH